MRLLPQKQNKGGHQHRRDDDHDGHHHLAPFDWGPPGFHATALLMNYSLLTAPALMGRGYNWWLLPRPAGAGGSKPRNALSSYGVAVFELPREFVNVTDTDTIDVAVPEVLNGTVSVN
jgi:hypothetical protein